MSNKWRRGARRAVASVALALLWTGATRPAFGAPPLATATAPEGRFIVTVAPHADPGSVANDIAHHSGARVHFVYRRALRGFAISGPPTVARALAHDRRIAAVERDSAVRATEDRAAADWGLDRLDQEAGPLDGHIRTAQTGAGVTAYIIDSGIRLSHAEFAGRVESGFDAVDGGAADDCNGHGTHVAGTVGGRRYGVAPGVHLVAVRVMDCDGTGSAATVIAGVDWVTEHHPASAPAVANMSIGGQPSPALDAAVRRAIASGVSFAVAAGNGDATGVGVDACTSSPARIKTAMTVGASDEADHRAPFSNTGSCVDWYAPGVGILSAWASSDQGHRRLSGTSMAAPHTAGVAALYLEAHPRASPATVQKALRESCFKEAISEGSGAGKGLLLSALV